VEHLTLERSPLFLGWYDADKRKPARLKIEAAVARYVEKWGRQPTEVLCSTEDAQHVGAIAGVTVESRHYVAKNTFYVGGEE
jgi:hypothetical protein